MLQCLLSGDDAVLYTTRHRKGGDKDVLYCSKEKNAAMGECPILVALTRATSKRAFGTCKYSMHGSVCGPDGPPLLDRF